MHTQRRPIQVTGLIHLVVDDQRKEEVLLKYLSLFLKWREKQRSGLFA